MSASTVTTRIAALKTSLAGGVAPAMATPLLPGSHTVNTAVVAPLVEFLLARGVKGLFVGGTTGEGTQLDDDQRRALHEAA
ncbi:MAG: dihydrodipicolinate synthase family protein, partial [Candidatus Promineofilum sp.]|nr:dihydrodipicolinate synthase family protein [Promineifilum sp.]